MTEKTNWQYLFEKFTSNTCTEAEFHQLLMLIEQEQYPEGLTEELRTLWERPGKAKSNDIDWDEKFSAMLKKANQGTPVIPIHNYRRKLYLKKWAVAASILILFSSGWYFFFSAKNNLSPQLANNGNAPAKPRQDIASGRDKAILTLTDGSTIVLDSAQNGMVTKQGNTRIIKMEDGRLFYHADQENGSEPAYNSIATPAGGKYEIVLPDGTKVWLNAASSLKFPVAFKGKVRKVILKGEAYFEVARNESLPFHVQVDDMTIEVLGTHFNVNAYDGENSVATTLLKGSVKVVKAATSNSSSRSALLKPGEQANLTQDGGLKINNHADLEEAMAWKNEKFVFNNADIAAIMREISRWYNVEIHFKGSISTRRFTGKFSRNVNLTQLIDMLQYTGINMKIEDKNVIISGN